MVHSSTRKSLLCETFLTACGCVVLGREGSLLHESSPLSPCLPLRRALSPPRSLARECLCPGGARGRLVGVTVRGCCLSSDLGCSRPVCLFCCPVLYEKRPRASINRENSLSLAFAAWWSPDKSKDTAARARSSCVRPSKKICRAPTRARMAGIESCAERWNSSAVPWPLWVNLHRSQWL